MITEYHATIESKKWKPIQSGFEPTFLPDHLFPFQRAIVRWACKKGRAAMFEDCGLGKAFQQLAWARNVAIHTGGNVLILAPLAVAEQTVREGKKFGIDVKHIRELYDVDLHKTKMIYVTNYDRLEKFTDIEWHGVVLDESSILKSHTGATRNALIESFAEVPYKLACTATPAPNDHTEIGNHAEFLGVMSRTEMLASFFVHDGGETATWRLKGHAEKDFWRWVAGWAVMIRKPSDIGFDDAGYELPPLNIIEHKMDSGIVEEGFLFTMPANTLQDQRSARRKTMEMRVTKAAEIANNTDDPVLVWGEMNDECDMLENAIGGSVQVAGSDDEEDKASRMLGFADGKHRSLVSKPKIAGWGMNWQHCNKMIFVGLSHSYESFYQSVRRCWRFGQTKTVDVHIISTDIESEVIQNIKRKQADADAMAEGMIANMKDIMNQEIHGTTRMEDVYKTGSNEGKTWKAHLGDCVIGISQMPSDSVHYSIFSPPFASLYTYSNSPYDMGNCKDDAEFMRQFDFLVSELFRVTMPGRLLSFHCMNMPTSKERDGYIGIRDFRGELIRLFISKRWIFHSEVCIWKDPVTAMQRTKALGLLHKQIKKDSCMSRQGIPDYLVTVRKPGDNPERVTHTNDTFPVDLWQRYASPIWMDINPSDTLQRESAREENDERHICPLQLEVIARGIEMWSNPGDTVLSPFMGIGSEGFQAIKMGRKFIGYELKQSYYNQAVMNLANAEQMASQKTIFDMIGDRS